MGDDTIETLLTKIISNVVSMGISSTTAMVVNHSEDMSTRRMDKKPRMEEPKHPCCLQQEDGWAPEGPSPCHHQHETVQIRSEEWSHQTSGLAQRSETDVKQHNVANLDVYFRRDVEIARTMENQGSRERKTLGNAQYGHETGDTPTIIALFALNTTRFRSPVWSSRLRKVGPRVRHPRTCQSRICRTSKLDNECVAQGSARLRTGIQEGSQKTRTAKDEDSPEAHGGDARTSLPSECFLAAAGEWSHCVTTAWHLQRPRTFPGPPAVPWNARSSGQPLFFSPLYTCAALHVFGSTKLLPRYVFISLEYYSLQSALAASLPAGRTVSD